MGTVCLRGAARRCGHLDRPGGHKHHEEPTPAVGGVAVLVALLVGAVVAGPLSPALQSVLLGALLLGAVGLADDLRGVHAVLKLVALAVAVAIAWRSGVALTLGLSPIVSYLATFLWVGLVASAFNGVDNADGAAGGLAALSCLGICAVGVVDGQTDLDLLAVVLLGATLGFLVFNFPWPRATIFLGDSGSLVIGYLLGSLTVLGEWSTSAPRSICIAVLLVFVPLFDFLFIVITRGMQGRYRTWTDPITMCDRDHTFHRLRNWGLGPRQALLALYIAQGSAIWIAVEEFGTPSGLEPLPVLALLGSGLLATCWLAARFSPSEVRTR